MRIELQFKAEKNEFPLEYRRFLLSFLKNCISKCNQGAYMSKYYESGKEKEYCFAVFFYKPQFIQDKIYSESDKVKMVFSTADKQTGFIFYSAFLENRNKKFTLGHDNNMTLIKVSEGEQQIVTGTEALFKLVSPLCIRRHNPDINQDYYYSYANEEFNEVFLYVVRRQLKNVGFSEEYTEDLAIEPIHCKKVIVKHYDCKLECTIGTIMLKGNNAVLQYLLNAGLGSRKSTGFGMLELLSNG